MVPSDIRRRQARAHHVSVMRCTAVLSRGLAAQCQCHSGSRRRDVHTQKLTEGTPRHTVMQVVQESGAVSTSPLRFGHLTRVRFAFLRARCRSASCGFVQSTLATSIHCCARPLKHSTPISVSETPLSPFLILFPLTLPHSLPSRTYAARLTDRRPPRLPIRTPPWRQIRATVPDPKLFSTNVALRSFRVASFPLRLS